MQDKNDFKSYAFKWGNFLILARITLITLRVAAHFFKNNWDNLDNCGIRVLLF